MNHQIKDKIFYLIELNQTDLARTEIVNAKKMGAISLAEDYFLRGIVAYQENDMVNTIRNFESSLETDPENEECRHCLIFSLYSLGFYELAHNIYKIYKSESQKNIKLQFEKHISLANTYRISGNYENCHKELEHAKAIQPKNKKLPFYYGLNYFKQQNWQEAIACFDMAKKNNVFTQDSSIYIGICYINLQKPELAEDYFKPYQSSKNSSSIIFTEYLKNYYDNLR